MFFLHAPKLVLTGSTPSLRATGDRAVALGAEVVVVDSPTVTASEPCLAELDGFDVALIEADTATGSAASTGADLLGAAALLAPGLRHGALVIVSGTTSAEQCGRRLAAELAERSGLEVGRQFDVVGVEGDVVAWSTGDEAALTARYLLARLGAAAPVTPVLHG